MKARSLLFGSLLCLCSLAGCNTDPGGVTGTNNDNVPTTLPMAPPAEAQVRVTVQLAPEVLSRAVSDIRKVQLAATP